MHVCVCAHNLAMDLHVANAVKDKREQLDP